MDPTHPVVRYLYLAVASISGAVTAIAFSQWKTMSRMEIALSFFVGSTFSIFVAPTLATLVFRIDVNNLQVLGATMYIGATASNALIPILVKKLTRRAGEEG